MSPALLFIRVIIPLLSDRLKPILYENSLILSRQVNSHSQPLDAKSVTFWKGGSAPNTAGKSAPRKSMPIVCRRNQSKLVLSLLLKSPISTPTFNVRTVSHVKVEETKFGGLIARYRMFVSGFIQLVFVAVISGVTGKYTSVPSGFRT